jgi:hypothetical protein
MAWDHRFRSGAVIAVTGVIAGANALRALLLGPDGTPAAATAMPQVDAVPQQDQRTQEQK